MRAHQVRGTFQYHTLHEGHKFRYKTRKIVGMKLSKQTPQKGATAHKVVSDFWDMSCAESTPLLPLVRCSYGPLTINELMNYANQPCWVRARSFVLALFATIWVVLLVAALSVAVAAPRCATKRCYHLQSPSGIYSKYF